MKALQRRSSQAFSAVSIRIVVGVHPGRHRQCVGGRVDNAISAPGIILSIPTFFLIVLMVALWGASPIVVIPTIASRRLDDSRTARARRVPVAARDRLRAGRARPLGAGDRRIIASRHMLPGAMAGHRGRHLAHRRLRRRPGHALLPQLRHLPPEASLAHMLTNALSCFFRAPTLIFIPGITPHPGRPVGQLPSGDGLRDASIRGSGVTS